MWFWQMFDSAYQLILTLDCPTCYVSSGLVSWKQIVNGNISFFPCNPEAKWYISAIKKNPDPKYWGFLQLNTYCKTRNHWCPQDEGFMSCCSACSSSYVICHTITWNGLAFTHNQKTQYRLLYYNNWNKICLSRRKGYTENLIQTKASSD